MEDLTNPVDAPAVAAAAAQQDGPGARWIEWIRQGLRAGLLRSVQFVPEGPGAWAMLYIVVAAAAIVTGATRLEVNGPATFDLSTWLFGWAPDAILIFG